MKVTVNDVARVDPSRGAPYSLEASPLQRTAVWQVVQKIRERLGEEAGKILEVLIIGFGGTGYDSNPSYLTVKAVFAISVPGGISKVEVHHPREYGFCFEEGLLAEFDNTPATIAKAFVAHALNVLQERLETLTNDQNRLAAIVAAVEERCKTTGA